MGNQFKKPFQTPEEQPSQVSAPSSIPEQSTLMSPAVHAPSASSVPPQGYAQGQQDQYGPRPSGQLLQNADQFGKQPANQLFPTRSDQQIFGQWQGNGSVNQSTGIPVNSLFGVVQTPHALPMQGSGTASGSQGLLAPAWNSQRASTSGLKEPPASVRSREKKQDGTGKKKHRTPIWARVVIGLLSVLIVFGILIGGVFIYYQVNYASVVNSVTSKPFTRLNNDKDPNLGKSGPILNWGRINLLLLGSDTDEKANWSGNSFLAQTVIVVSIDTKSHDVDMLSIPRDYWINIPGYGMDKLDTAFAHGGSINHDMSGVSEVALTLDQDFGIKINFYAWVGLQGFIKVIDTVHGVDVNVIHPVVDDTYPDDVGTKGAAQSNYKRVYIPDGPQHLDGPTALEYVRSRHSTNDFDRSARQQQVLSALKLKLDNAGVFSELPQIAKDLQGSVYTSLNPGQILDLGNFARGVDANKIKHLTLGGSKYSTSGTVKLASGATEDVVHPICEAIIPAINAFLHISTATCNGTTSTGEFSSLLATSSGSGTGAVTLASTLASVSASADTSQAFGAGISSFSDLFGLRDILDLMSMVVLDSPQA